MVISKGLWVFHIVLALAFTWDGGIDAFKSWWVGVGIGIVIGHIIHWYVNKDKKENS